METSVAFFFVFALLDFLKNTNVLYVKKKVPAELYCSLSLWMSTAIYSYRYF